MPKLLKHPLLAFLAGIVSTVGSATGFLYFSTYHIVSEAELTQIVQYVFSLCGNAT